MKKKMLFIILFLIFSLLLVACKKKVELDLFKDITVEFSGMSPNGSVKIKNTSDNDFISSVKYTPNKSIELSNGDTIVITAEYSEEDAQNMGYIIKKKTKKYKVSGLSKYIDEPDEISKEEMSILLKKAQSLVNDKNEKIKKSVVDGGTVTIDETKLDKKILLCKKADAHDTLGLLRQNKVLFVFKTHVDIKSALLNINKDVYYSCEVEDIIINFDRTYDVDLSKMQLKENDSYYTITGNIASVYDIKEIE